MRGRVFLYGCRVARTNIHACMTLRCDGGRAVQMEELAALVNILLVSPDSLIGLVQTSLHMSHKQALQYIRLREDFATAKVDGVPLAKIFSHE